MERKVTNSETRAKVKLETRQYNSSTKLPTYREMITTALENIKQPYGLGQETILEYILRKYNISDKTKARQYVKSSLTKGVKKGYFKVIKESCGVVSYKLIRSKMKPKTNASNRRQKIRSTSKKKHTTKTPKQLSRTNNPIISRRKAGRNSKKRKSPMKSLKGPLPRKRNDGHNLLKTFEILAVNSGASQEESIKERCDALSSITVEHMEPVCLKALYDDSDCYIVGLDVTEDGIIVVADFNNKNIKLFSNDGKWLMSRSLSARPSGYNAIAVVNKEEVLLNMWSEGKLYVLDLKTNLLATKETIPISHSLLSVCCCQDKIFATSGVGVPSVMQMDRKGTVHWSRSVSETDQCLFKSPFYSTCFQDGDRLVVLVADDSKGTITSLDGATGAVLKVLNAENKSKRSVGPVAYGSGHLYIWNPEGKEINVWNTGLKNKTSVISDLRHGLSGCMKYDEIKGHLMVTYGWFSPNPNFADCFKFAIDR